MPPLLFVVAAMLAAGAASATAQGDVAQRAAELMKGKPASMPADEWDVARIEFFSRLRDRIDLERDSAAARPAIPLLRTTLQDRSPEVAVSAAGTLLRADPSSRQLAMGALAAGLKSTSDQAQQWALDDLAGLGIFDNLPLDAETLLVQFLRQSNSHARYKAARALGSVPSARVAAVSAILRQAMSDRDPAVRSAAAEALKDLEHRRR
jgi:HEAT repeat protein